MQPETRTLNRRAFLGTVAMGVMTLGAYAIFSPAHALAAPTSAEKQIEADAAKVQLDAAQAAAASAAEVYYEALDAHDAALVAMDAAQIRIDDAQTRIIEKQGHLSTRAVSMYRSGSTSFLDVLLGAGSFEEFISTWDILNDLNDQDATLIAEVKDLRAEAQAAHDEYATQEKVAAEKLEEAETAKADLDEKVTAQQTLYDGLSDEVAELLAAEEAERVAAEEAAAAAAAAATVTTTTNNGGGSSSSGTFVGGSGPYGSVAEAALSRVGAPYVWGASGPDSFDCSGLVYWSFRAAGLSAPPRSSSGMRSAAKGVYPVSEAQYGDVLWKSGHVGISLGGNSYVHAPTSGQDVCVRNNASSAFTYVLRF